MKEYLMTYHITILGGNNRIVEDKGQVTGILHGNNLNEILDLLHRNSLDAYKHPDGSFGGMRSSVLVSVCVPL